MSSGFPGDFFTSGRTINNTTNNINMNNNNNTTHVPYRSGILSDRVVGKRNLAEFQQQNPLHLLNHQQQQQGMGMGMGHILRSVKQRLYQNTSPISPLSPIDFSGTILPDISQSPGRFGLPIFQQVRLQQQQQQQQQQGNFFSGTNNNNNTNINGNGNYGFSSNLSYVPNRVNSNESEKKRLQEIEKQLLVDEEDDDQNDDVSVLTGSEWSETMMNLVTPNNQNSTAPTPPPPSSSSPTTSTSSSSCSSSSTSTSSKQSVLEAATAISDGKTEIAANIVARLSQLGNHSTGSPEQRLLYYMSLALKLRLCPQEVDANNLRDEKGGEVLIQLLNQHSNCFKFGHMAANFAIIEATSDAASFRVIDFNIGQGGQHLNLIQLLSRKKSGIKPNVVKITAVKLDSAGGEDMMLGEVKEKLSHLGVRVGIRVEFNVVVVADVASLSRESLGCDTNEALVVNLAYKLHKVPDESVMVENPRDALLRRVKELGPHVVTLVEQEMNCNTAPFLTRVGECWAYYGALFDSLEGGGLGRDDLDRVKIEEGLSRKMLNSVACEGRDRVERCEVFGKWRARMSMAGFKMNPVSQRVVDSLNNSGTRVGQGYLVKEECGGVHFGWMGRTLTVSSAWR